MEHSAKEAGLNVLVNREMTAEWEGGKEQRHMIPGATKFMVREGHILKPDYGSLDELKPIPPEELGMPVKERLTARVFVVEKPG